MRTIEMTLPVIDIRTSDQQCNFEILVITDSGVRARHLVMIEVTTRTHTTSQGASTFDRASIEVKATYLSGGAMSAGAHISTMGGNMSSHSQSVRLTNGSVLIDPAVRGLGLGSYMFRKIVDWARGFDQAFKIVPISVTEADATSDNKARRNKFYGNFGITFIWSQGLIDERGRSDPNLTVAQLQAHGTWPHITANNGFEVLQDCWQDLEKERATVGRLQTRVRWESIRGARLRGRLKMMVRMANIPMFIALFAIGLMSGVVLMGGIDAANAVVAFFKGSR